MQNSQAQDSKDSNAQQPTPTTVPPTEAVTSNETQTPPQVSVVTNNIPNPDLERLRDENKKLKDELADLQGRIPNFSAIHTSIFREYYNLIGRIDKEVFALLRPKQSTDTKNGEKIASENFTTAGQNLLNASKKLSELKDFLRQALQAQAGKQYNAALYDLSKNLLHSLINLIRLTQIELLDISAPTNKKIAQDIKKLAGDLINAFRDFDNIISGPGQALARQNDIKRSQTELKGLTTLKEAFLQQAEYVEQLRQHNLQLQSDIAAVKLQLQQQLMLMDSKKTVLTEVDADQKRLTETTANLRKELKEADEKDKQRKLDLKKVEEEYEKLKNEFKKSEENRRLAESRCEDYKRDLAVSRLDLERALSRQGGSEHPSRPPSRRASEPFTQSRAGRHTPAIFQSQMIVDRKDPPKPPKTAREYLKTSWSDVKIEIILRINQAIEQSQGQENAHLILQHLDILQAEITFERYGDVTGIIEKMKKGEKGPVAQKLNLDIPNFDIDTKSTGGLSVFLQTMYTDLDNIISRNNSIRNNSDDDPFKMPGKQGRDQDGKYQVYLKSMIGINKKIIKFSQQEVGLNWFQQYFGSILSDAKHANIDQTLATSNGDTNGASHQNGFHR